MITFPPLRLTYPPGLGSPLPAPRPPCKAVPPPPAASAAPAPPLQSAQRPGRRSKRCRRRPSAPWASQTRGSGVLPFGFNGGWRPDLKTFYFLGHSGPSAQRWLSLDFFSPASLAASFGSQLVLVLSHLLRGLSKSLFQIKGTLGVQWTAYSIIKLGQCIARQLQKHWYPSLSNDQPLQGAVYPPGELAPGLSLHRLPTSSSALLQSLNRAWHVATTPKTKRKTKSNHETSITQGTARPALLGWSPEIRVHAFCVCRDSWRREVGLKYWQTNAD